MNEADSLKKKFGSRVKYLRKMNKITQEQLSGLIHIEPPNISKMEKGVHFPSPRNIEKLAEILQVEIKDLFDFDNLNENLNQLSSLKKNKRVDKSEKKNDDVSSNKLENNKDELLRDISDFLNHSNVTYNDLLFIYDFIQSFKSYKIKQSK